jgi:hypothetical protein
MNEILTQIKKYIEDQQASKKWVAGKDFVNYAGPYFDEHEIMASVSTLLDGWLVMGDQSLKFEKQFPKQFQK